MIINLVIIILSIGFLRYFFCRKMRTVVSNT